MAEKKQLNKTDTSSVMNKMKENTNVPIVMTEYDVTDDEMLAFVYSDHVPSMHTTSSNKPIDLMISENEYQSHSLTELLKIPDYLLAITTNKCFEEMLQQKIYHSASSINLENLRRITILMHQLYVLDLEKSLWNQYLKSGTGLLLQSTKPNLTVWPANVKTKIRIARRITTNDDLNKIEVNDDHCLRFVNQYLCELNGKQQLLQQQLIENKKSFYGYTNTMENILQTFIKDQIKSIRLQYEYDMKMIEFQYHEEVFHYKFQEQNPKQEQIEFIKRLCDRKYKYEKAKYDVKWIKQYVNSYKLPKVIHNLEQLLQSSIQPLVDKDVRQQLSDRHGHIMQQYKNELMMIFTDTMEDKLREFEKIFHDELTTMWLKQRTHPVHEQFNQTTINLIETHLLMITEKVQYIYQYKSATISD